MSCCTFGGLDLSTLTLTVEACNLVVTETIGGDIITNIPIKGSIVKYNDGVLSILNGVKSITLADADMVTMSAVPATIVAAVNACLGKNEFKQKMIALDGDTWSPDANTVYYRVHVVTAATSTFTDSDTEVTSLADGMIFWYEDREHPIDVSPVVTAGAGANIIVTWITY